MRSPTRPLPPEVIAAYRLQTAGRRSEAEAAYRDVLASQPDQIVALDQLALLCRQRGGFAEALQLYAAMMTVAPGSPEAASNHGVVLNDLGRPTEALASLDRALVLKPDFAPAHYNRGNALFALGRYDDALASFECGLALDRRHVDAHYNRANALRELRRHEAALAAYRDALALAPERADIHVNAALTLLRVGRLGDGFAEYEWRHKLAPIGPPGPIWRGDVPVAGKTVFLHAEQGFGDTLQFIRYAPLLAARGAKVFAAVPAALKPLVAAMPGVTALTAGDPQPDYDFHCPMMSLPHAFGTELATVPAQMPYLAAAPDRLRLWADRLPQSDNLKVGLAWAGSRGFVGDRQRSIALAGLAPLLALDGVDFVALQRDVPMADISALAAVPRLVSLGPQLRDFADTAAIVTQLDLVIAVDTALVHLAGALGKPVWVMLPYSPDFRWMLDRPDSPWYPSARLFRQCRPGDWDEVVAGVAAALELERDCGMAARARLIAAGRYREALAASERAIAHQPEAAAVHHDRGTALAELGRLAEAREAFARVIEISPGFSAAIFNQGLVDLTLGDYADGWRKYEHRFAANRVPPPVTGPRFDPAEPVAARTVLVAAEQGFGDAFQFARYVPMVAACGARVAFAVPSPLAGVMATLSGVSQIITTGEALPSHDFAIPLLSLPRAFATRLDTIPAQVPYLAADPARVAYWRDRLPDAPRIGLVWSGTQSFSWAAQRSIPFAQMSSLLTASSGSGRPHFVSLQRDLSGADKAHLREQPNIVHFGTALRDFADTAAIIAQLDLVITIDSAVAHLAGAMARPLWVMLPYVPDFRWLLDRDDSPWYPTARLFRQPSPGDWTSVIAQVATELSPMNCRA
jgi:tetratricopeptide (TPR) repeat protein